jgi:hypothetical protein
MLALTFFAACRVHAPAKPCAHVMLGACVEPTPTPVACERGRARNLDDGSCVTTRETRDLARTTGVYVDENDAIECEGKADELVASLRLGRIGCIARESPLPPCQVRTVRAGDACSPLDRGGSVDLASWSRAAAVEVCARLLRSPLAVASPESTVEVSVDASVPNNDLSQGFVRLRARPSIAERDVANATASLDDALRRLGGTASGTANATEASASATCRTSSRRPISVP